MPTMQLKDVNGKEFSIDDAKIADINGDLLGGFSTRTSDARQKNRVAQVKDIEYIDQHGTVLDSMKVLQDMQNGVTKVYALDVDMEATHSGKNHNYCIYKERSMEKDAESFLNPFYKPMLKNHNDYSGEPLGRIRKSYHAQSSLTDERSAIFLTARVTDQDAIPKFLDGRYATVSIGGTMGTVTCNVCGKTILRDGKFKFCGHYKGEAYKDQVCYWDVEDIEYNEVSVVNNPADDFAQITKITVITDAANKDGAQTDAKEGETPVMDTSSKDSTKESLLDAIDSALAVKDSTQSEENQAETSVPPVVDNEEQPAVTIDSLQQENEKLLADIADLTTKLNDATLATAEAEKKMNEALQDALVMKDQFIELAKANKETIIDFIVNMESIEDANVEQRRLELASSSMRELEKSLADAKVVQPKRTMASVPNPTLSNSNEQHTEVVDNKKQAATNGVQDSNKKATIDDYANAIIGKLLK